MEGSNSILISHGLKKDSLEERFGVHLFYVPRMALTSQMQTMLKLLPLHSPKSTSSVDSLPRTRKSFLFQPQTALRRLPLSPQRENSSRQLESKVSTRSEILIQISGSSSLLEHDMPHLRTTAIINMQTLPW